MSTIFTDESVNNKFTEIASVHKQLSPGEKSEETRRMMRILTISAIAGGILGAGVGFVLGTFVPVVGNITGSIAGAALGIAIGVAIGVMIEEAISYRDSTKKGSEIVPEPSDNRLSINNGIAPIDPYGNAGEGAKINNEEVNVTVDEDPNLLAANSKNFNGSRINSNEEEGVTGGERPNPPRDPDSNSDGSPSSISDGFDPYEALVDPYEALAEDIVETTRPKKDKHPNPRSKHINSDSDDSYHAYDMFTKKRVKTDNGPKNPGITSYGSEEEEVTHDERPNSRSASVSPPHINYIDQIPPQEPIVTKKQPKAIFLVGSSGSGKTTVREKIMEKHSEKYQVISKETLAKRRYLFEELLVARQSFIYDSTGSNKDWYFNCMTAVEQSGYKVKVVYVETQKQLCVDRCEKRASYPGGRAVAKGVIESTYPQIQANWPEYQQRADSWQHYDNNGNAPVVVDSSKKKKKAG